MSSAAAVQIRKRDFVRRVVGPIDPSRRRIDRNAGTAAHGRPGGREISSAGSIEIRERDRSPVGPRPIQPAADGIDRKSPILASRGAVGVQSATATTAIEIGNGHLARRRVVVAPINMASRNIEHGTRGPIDRRTTRIQICSPAGPIQVRVGDLSGRDPIAPVDPVDRPSRGR